MKTPLIFLLSLCLFNQLPAQSADLTGREVKAITDQLVTILNGKRFDGTLIVDNFVNLDGTTTELGAHLASKARTQFINAPAPFEVVQRPASLEAPRRRPIDLSSKMDETQLINSYDENAELKSTGIDIGVGLLEGLLNKSRNPRYKGVDAIVTGKLVTFEDHYTLTIAVIDKKKENTIAEMYGQITNTSGLSVLDGSELPDPSEVTRGAGSSGGGISRTSSGKATHFFSRLHLNYELIECVKNGSYLECYLRLNSEGKVTRVSTYPGYGKIVNQEDGADFQSSTIHLGDVTSYGYIEKELQPNTPIDLVVTFEPKVEIEAINKFQLRMTAEGVGEFVVEMKDIFVNY